MKFPRLTNTPPAWTQQRTQYNAPKQTPVVAAAAPIVTGHRIKAQAGVRTMEEHVARQLYYEMARFSGVDRPPHFSGLHVQTQSMYVSMASAVIRFLETQIEE